MGGVFKDGAGVKVYRLSLPMPPSANRFWRTAVIKGKPIIHVSKEAKDYKRTVGFLAIKEGIREPIVGPVSLKIRMYPSRPKDWRTRASKDALWHMGIKCIDLDNALKVAIDSLKDIAFGDDKWVHHISTTRMIPDGGGARLEITITPIDMVTFTL